MAYDDKLAEKVRGILKGKHGVTEKKMFGGLCFLHHGNMLCGVDNKGRLMIRVGADNYPKALKSKHARQMDFTGKPLKGMVYVAAEGIRSQAALRKWLEQGLSFTGSLPRK